MLQLRINGELRSFEHVVSVADLVRVLALGAKRIAVERNGEILPKSHHASALLSNGDELEIVVAVGGG